MHLSPRPKASPYPRRLTARITPKAYPIEPSKAPAAVQAWTPDKELIEKRTASSRTFAGTKPGRFETRLYSEAVNFKKGNQWAEIDATLTPLAVGKLTNKANNFGLELADYSDARSLAKLQLDKSHSVSFGIDQAARVKGKVAKDAVTYPMVKKLTDVRLTSQRNGLKEELILSSPAAPTRFVFPLILQGLTASIEANGDVVYTDSKGSEWARTPHGFMFDSNVDPRSGESAVSTGVDYALVPHADGVALEVTLDREWLGSPERVWPVTVDPQVHAVRTWGDDTYVMRNFTRNNSADPELKVGTYDGGVHIGQSYAHFDTAPLAGKFINSATLYAAEQHSWNCNVGPGPVYRVTQPWNGSAMTTFPGAPIDSNPAAGAWYPGIGSCHDRLAYWMVTPQVAQMAAEGQTAGSFSFRAPNEADNNQYKKYLSFEAGNGPYLSVDYTTGDPIGSVDESTPVAGGIRVRGWVIDPDTAASTQVHIYVGSAGVALNANTYRPDVGSAYPGYGNNHGFDAVISAGPGTHNVCFYGINIAGPGNNPLLGGGCRTITVAGASVPGIPANATATANPDGSVAVSWSPPATNPWSPVDLYVAYSYNADDTYSGQFKIVNCTGPCTSTSFTGLPIAGQRFYIYAHNAGGYGSPAVTNTVTPKTIPSPPTNAVATAQPDGTVKVSWTLSSSNGGATMGVHVVYVYRVLSNGNLEYANKYSTPCATCTEDFFNDLTVGTTYKFYVYATNTVGASATAAESNAVEVTAAVPTVPDIPGNPEATLDGDNVEVTWTAPVGGAAVTSYRVQAHVTSTDAAGPQKTCDSPCTSVEFTTGLTAGTAYKFKIYAVNPVGDSPAAVTGAVTVPNPGPDPTVPFAPVDVQAVGSSSQVVVTWQPAPDQSDGTPGDGGSPLTGHSIVLDPPCGGCTGTQVPGEAVSTNIVGVEPGTTYVITVTATNGVGTSTPSDPVQYTTDPEAPGAPTITEIVGGDGVATVSWNPPTELNGSAIQGYELSLEPACPQCAGLQAGSSSLYSDVTGMTNDVQYAIRVAATTAEGAGEWSEPASVTPHRPTYAALGDSFSAGQGAPPYDWDSVEQCKRSSQAYGPQFVSPYSGFEEVQFLACAGAVIDEVSTQIDQIEGHPDLITLTAGGNDARFGEILRNCFLSPPTISCDASYADQPALIDSLYEPLSLLYTKAKNRASARDADVLVFGYPQLFRTAFADFCEGDHNYSHQERIWIRSMVSRMNDVIQQAGDAAGVTVVQLAGRAPDGQDPIDSRPFDGHEICSSQEYVNGLTLEDDKYFHPNGGGYGVMASLLAAAWEDLRP